ncbi:MAG: PAS domain S-box protein [Methylomonas sp.]|nr:PAS domain S-box protein [Methylomonas sp.]
MIYSDELYVFNADSLKICWISSQALRSLGYTRQQIEDKYIFDVYPQLNNHHFPAFIRPLIDDETAVMRRQTWQHGKQGYPKPVYLHMELFSDAGVRFIHARVEPIQSSDNLSRHQLQMTQYVMDNVSIEVYWLDRYGHIQYANRQACLASGFSQEEISRLNVDAIDLLFPTESWERYWQVLKRDGSLFVETLQRSRSGRVYPVKVLTNHLRFGDLDYAVMFVRDISQSRQLKARLSTLISVIHAIVWSTDGGWRIDYVSPQVKELLGLPADDFIGQTLDTLFNSELIHGDDRAILLDSIHALRNGTGEVNNIQFRIMNAESHWQWMALSMSAIGDVNGCLQQVVGSCHDISLQKQEESRLRDLNAELDLRVQRELAKNRLSDQLLQQQARLAAMGEMIANIAHQWRQPLNTLAIILLNLEDEIAYGEIRADNLHQALRRSQEILSDMSRTIDDFRGYFKANKALKAEVLSEIIRTNVRMLEPTMVYHNIELKCVDADNSLSALVHFGELSQVILCLVNNAKEQIVERHIRNGKVIIDLEQQGDYVVISVSDNAGGIEEEILSKIFDPYFTTKPEGLGLGLYMSMLTVRHSMQGRIEVKNGSDGAIFSVFIPKIVTQEPVLS